MLICPGLAEKLRMLPIGCPSPRPRMGDTEYKFMFHGRRFGKKPSYFYLNGHDLNAITESTKFDENKIYEYFNGELHVYERH
jgi:hypothetical protein